MLRFHEDVRGGSEFLGFCHILGLDPTLKYYRLEGDRDGQIPGQHINCGGVSVELREEIVVRHRSLKEAMYYLSQVVEVPDSHIEDGIAQQHWMKSAAPLTGKT